MPDSSFEKKNESNTFVPYDVNGRLLQLLKANGVSKYRAAKISGISRGTVYSWFRRNNSPKVSDLEAVCQRVFHMTLSDFFHDADPENPEDPNETVFLEQFRTLTAGQRARLYATVDDFVQANANRTRLKKN